MAATLEEPPVKQATALEKLLGSDYTIQHEMWSNIHWTDRGIARLQHTIGFLKGLSMCGKEELAAELAESLCSNLAWLNDYGGIVEIDMAEEGRGYGGGILKTPAYRVVLSDDGTFGGFGVLWYRYVSVKKWREHCEKNPGNENEGWQWWQQRLYEEGKCRKELDLHRYYYPILDGKEAERMDSEVIRYSYSMNGGLLFHGFGNQTFSVDLGQAMGKKTFWSIHT